MQCKPIDGGTIAQLFRIELLSHSQDFSEKRRIRAGVNTGCSGRLPLGHMAGSLRLEWVRCFSVAPPCHRRIGCSRLREAIPSFASAFTQSPRKKKCARGFKKGYRREKSVISVKKEKFDVLATALQEVAYCSGQIIALPRIWIYDAIFAEMRTVAMPSNSKRCAQYFSASGWL